MESEHLAILLAMLGFLLLVAEVFIPSGGLIFVMAFACLIGGGWCAWNAWWESNPLYFWIYSGGVMIALPITGVALFRVWERVILATNEADEQMTRPAPNSELLALVGKMGETATPLNPSGLVLIEGQRVHASSEGMIVERGRTVSVVSIQGNHLVVRIAEPTSRSDMDNFVDAVDPEEDDRLDFDVAQG